MKKEFIKSIATVYCENGMHFILLPNGTKIPNIIKTIVEDTGDNQPALVKVEFLCNICSTKEEALKLYEKE